MKKFLLAMFAVGCSMITFGQGSTTSAMNGRITDTNGEALIGSLDRYRDDFCVCEQILQKTLENDSGVAGDIFFGLHQKMSSCRFHETHL